MRCPAIDLRDGRAWRACPEWAKWNSKVDFPAAAADVASWVAERANAGQAITTLRVAVAAIKAGHAAKGIAFDTTAPELGLTLKGITRTKARPQRQVEGLRGGDVLAIIKLLHRTDATVADLRDAALLAVGYVFALRRSELVALDWRTLGDGDGNVTITPRTIELAIIRSKSAAGQEVKVVVRREENDAAVRIIERWAHTSQIANGSPLICRVSKRDKIEHERICADTVVSVIRRRVVQWRRHAGDSLTLAEEKAATYAGHSLRVGFATTAAEAGGDLRAIASVTRHKSLAMPQRYAQKADQLRTSPFKLKGVGLTQT